MKKKTAKITIEIEGSEPTVFENIVKLDVNRDFAFDTVTIKFDLGKPPREKPASVSPETTHTMAAMVTEEMFTRAIQMKCNGDHEIVIVMEQPGSKEYASHRCIKCKQFIKWMPNPMKGMLR